MSRQVRNKLMGLAVATLLLTHEANAGIVFDILENGGTIEVTVTGSINLDAIAGTPSSAFNTSSFVAPNAGLVAVGNPEASESYQLDVGASLPAFGTGGDTFGFDGTGDRVSLFDGKKIGLPTGYVSGNNLSGSASLATGSPTFASLGMTPGTYVTTITNGGSSDTITINVGSTSAPIPEPSSAIAMGLLFGLGFAGRRHHRRKPLVA